MSDLTAIVLPSGLGIRYKALTPTQVDTILETATVGMPPDATFMKLQNMETRLGLEAMIKQVSVGPCKRSEPKGEYDANHGGNEWKPFDPDAYEDTITDPRDHAVLKRIYIDLHHVSPAEVQAIMGKAVMVVA